MVNARGERVDRYGRVTRARGVPSKSRPSKTKWLQRHGGGGWGGGWGGHGGGWRGDRGGGSGGGSSSGVSATGGSGGWGSSNV